MGWKAIGVALSLSAAVHAAPAGVSFARAALHGGAQRADAGLAHPADARPRRSAEAISADRRALIDRARAARREGTLELGDFLLRAAALDAEELGYELDAGEARRRYDEGLARARAALDAGDEVVSLLRRAHGPLHYQSIGGSMADALIDGGGSCEQLSHLLAATMYDLGLGSSAFVRYWGGGDMGHLAPVYLHPAAGEVDLVRGVPPRPGGARVPAADLIEIYARAHEPGARAGGATGWSDGRATFAGGYPPNADAYDGSAPVFALDALRAGMRAGGGADDEEPPLHCAPPDWTREIVEVLPSKGEGYQVELVPSRDRADIAFAASDIERRERHERRATGVEQVLSRACLSWLYEDIATDLSIAGLDSLVTAAIGRARVWRRRAGEAFAAVDWNEARRRELGARDDLWLLAGVPGADALSLELLGAPDLQADAIFNVARLLTVLAERDAIRPQALAAFDAAPAPFQLGVLMMFCEELCPRLPPDSDASRARRATEAMLSAMERREWPQPNAFLEDLERAGVSERFIAQLRAVQEAR